MVDGGETKRFVLSLLRVILEPLEAQTRERGGEVVRRTSDGVDEAVGVVADVVREVIGGVEHHQLLYYFRVLFVKRTDRGHLRRKQLVTGQPVNLAYRILLFSCSWPVAASTKLMRPTSRAPRLRSTLKIFFKTSSVLLTKRRCSRFSQSVICFRPFGLISPDTHPRNSGKF